jgi:glutamyl/glutaminyl-tRNA synthetase
LSGDPGLTWITRFAPTPSGYLHLGNAVHLRLLDMLAAENDWVIRLRIDDLDPARTRPEYVEDIYELVDWLEVPIAGEVWHQSDHLEDYRAARDELLQNGAYVCACSRSEWAEHSGPGCPRGCSGLELRPGETTLRMRLAEDDIVVWRREGIAAYHLASLVDDDAMRTTHVLRGEDLADSTRVQRKLAMRLQGSRFTDAEVIQHPLVTDTVGEKLSKSAGAQASPLPRTSQMREEIERIAESLLPGITSLRT